MSDEQEKWNLAFQNPTVKKVDAIEFEKQYNEMFLNMIQKKEQPNNEN